jgi:Winged helix DNA-binding domain
MTRRLELTRTQILAFRRSVQLAGTKMSYADAGRALDEPPNRLRYAALTGRVLMRWDGAKPPVIWVTAPPGLAVSDARLELARRYLHVFGPTTADAFAQWAGVPARAGRATFDALRRSLIPARTPLGDAWMLASDEPSIRACSNGGPFAPARLLPSGDTMFLLQGADRTLLVPDAKRRRELWTSRVWPGALLTDGAVAGTWRRAHTAVMIQTWRRLSRPERQAVEAEVTALPLPDGRATIVGLTP